MLTRLFRLTLAPLLALSALPSTIQAQCVPDGLDFGPCCTLAQPNLPVPRAFRQDTLQICWRDCDVEAVENCSTEWSLGSYNTTPCAIRKMTVKMRDAAGSIKWRGKITLQYSRTWSESDATGIEQQVWRFLPNGDLRPTAAAGAVPCPVPPCASAHGNRVRFTGYVDMARSCFVTPGTTARPDFAWMLTHACDLLDHAPGFPRAGSFHPDRTYTFVGPAAGFAISPITPVASGGTSLDAVRRVRLGAGPPMCEYEEQIDCGLAVIQEFCLCGSPTGPFQYAISDLGLGGSCGTSVFTPGGPFLPGYLSMGIGSWTDPTTYPGIESLRWNCGGYDYFDPCSGVTRQEVFYGVTTLGGNAASTIPTVGLPVSLPLAFVDQCNALRSGVTVMNVPWRQSDHVLNLNFP